jgi:hypothetical protein
MQPDPWPSSGSVMWYRRPGYDGLERFRPIVHVVCCREREKETGRERDPAFTVAKEKLVMYVKGKLVMYVEEKLVIYVPLHMCYFAGQAAIHSDAFDASVERPICECVSEFVCVCVRERERVCVCVGEWVRVCCVCVSGWVSGCEFVVRESG